MIDWRVLLPLWARVLMQRARVDHRPAFVTSLLQPQTSPSLARRRKDSTRLAMAGIITPQFGFRPAAVDHSPSPLGFGFGLSSAASVPGWQPPGMQAAPFSPAPSAFSGSHKASQKRRHDETDGDELMDRSPTPERRPVRPIKQMRIRSSESRSQDTIGDHDKASKENRSSRANSGHDVDIGMLLGASIQCLE